MTLLGVAVLVGLARLDRLPLQSVMPQQRLVAGREEGRAFRPRRNGRRQPVGAVKLRHPAQGYQRILQALAQALEALGEADRPRFPVRVGQYEVVDHVVQRHAVDGDAQRGAVCEVAGAQPTRMVNLAEEHLFGRAVQRTPLLDVALQGAQLAVGEASRKTALQVVEQGLGLQSGVEAEQLGEFRPDRGERVRACAVVAVHASHLAGQFAESAVLACGLGIEAGLVGGPLLRQSTEIEALKSSHLLIGDHPEPPVSGGSG